MAEEIQDSELWNRADKGDNSELYKIFMDALSSKDLISLILFEEDGEIVGFANLLTIFSVWSYGKALILDDLYLRPEVRGKGYGKQALLFIEEYARLNGHKRLQFQSELTNPSAMNFYMAIGYKPVDMKFYVKYLK